MNIVLSCSERIKVTKSGTGYPGFFMRDYQLDNPLTSMAEIAVSIRYPAKGMVVNTLCDMSAIVKQGSGFIETTQGRKRFSAGDFIEIKKSEEFFIESTKLSERGYEVSSEPSQIITLIASFSPAWTSEQHQTVE